MMLVPLALGTCCSRPSAGGLPWLPPHYIARRKNDDAGSGSACMHATNVMTLRLAHLRNAPMLQACPLLLRGNAHHCCPAGERAEGALPTRAQTGALAGRTSAAGVSPAPRKCSPLLPC